MFEELPGGEIVSEGLNDLRNGKETIPALLVAIGAPKLTQIGIDLPNFHLPVPEHRLYDLLAAEDSDAAHSRYNALLRKLVSFERAASCVKVNLELVEEFMGAFARGVKSPTRVYLVGGATAVMFGWRESTIEIDLKLISETDVLKTIPEIKESLQVNVELASPDDFIPALPGVGDEK